MIRKRRLFANVLMSVVQVVVTGGSFLVLYRFVKDTLGIEQFGVWSLVLATTATSHIANLGLASGTVKFVSMYLARERMDHVVRIIQTAALTLAAFLAVVLIVLYPVFLGIIRATVEQGLFEVARSVLPYALASLWINATAGVFQAGLDGAQRVDLRGVLLSAAALVYLGLALWLVPQHGLVGLAQAQVWQAGILLVGSWGMLKRLLPALPPLPYRWDRAAFREMLGYSLNFQVMSTVRMLFEPLTKILMMHFGGAAAAGYFEFAYRMVFQFRALIVTAHQALVPTIADLQERAPELIRDVYVTSFRLLLYLVLASLPMLLLLTPWISRLWIGTYEVSFVLFADLLFVGWFLNMLSNPAYFAYLGIGRLRWNVAGHVIIGVLNGGLGALLGWLFGATGVVAAFVAALLTGSLFILVAYQRETRIRTADLVSRDSLVLGAAALAGLSVAALAYLGGRAVVGRDLLVVPVVAGYLVVVALPLWRHGARRQVQSWITDLLRRPAAEPTEHP